MCLAVPGRIVAIRGLPVAADDSLWRMAEVDFGGVRQLVSLACLPEAVVGDRVLVHVGIALTIVEEEPA
jgi:hydrogenase expression/formation protein HypC